MSDISPQASQPATAVVMDESHQLGKGRLRVWDAVGQSVGLLALIMALAITTGTIAIYAGVAAPLAYLVAGLASLCLAYVFIRFTRSMASAGSIYTYVAKGLGSEAGFIGGWLYAGAFAFGVSFTLAVASMYATFFLGEVTNNPNLSSSWLWFFLGGIVLLFLFAFFDIRISTRFQLVVTAIGVIAILVLVFAILGKGGNGGLSADPFNPGAVSGGFSSLFFAVIFGFTAFGGFESSASLGEESVNPRRAIPSAILVSIIVAVVFFTLTTYAFSVGYGATAKGAAAWASDGAPLDTLATKYVSSTLAEIIDLLVAIDAFIASLAGLNMSSRVVFAMGRDRGLPPIFGRSHPRYKSPWIAILFILLITLVLGVWPGQTVQGGGGLPPAPQPLPFVIFMATTATLGILGGYLLVAISGLVYYQRHKEEGGGSARAVWQILFPIIAIVIVAAALFSSIYPIPPAAPLTTPLNYTPWIFAGWLVLGIIIVVILRVVNPAQVSKFGQIVATGEGGSQEGAPAAGD